MEITENNQITTNIIFTKYVIYSFTFLFVVIGLNILIDALYYLNLIDSILVTVIFETHRFYFYINSIIYLLWYFKINSNYRILFKKQNETDFGGSILVWFIPIINIILPYIRLKAISVDYQKGEINDTKLKNKTYLIVWASSFVCWYLIGLIVMINIPLFPEDIDMYYMMHPTREFIDSNSVRMLELIGLYAMIKIVNEIQMLEKKFINKDDNFDVTDHLVK